ncbi:MAG: activator of (R)-2-hydroxyglutaryl-CoA dehydratase [Acidobacteriota bacterium]
MQLVTIQSPEELKQRLEAEKQRLRREAGLTVQHFQRPIERPFTAEERKRVTILFGGLTWKHEELMKAVFRGSGYRCENLATPNVAAFQTGKEYGNNGQCNPTYFTVGNLVQHLQLLESQGLSRQEILDNYVFFTAGSCGPCRFGMYEAEYRFALKNAGFDGFRILLFHDKDGLKASCGEPGLRFNVDFGLGMLNAFHLGDVIQDLSYQIRPFEVNRGETDKVFRDMVEILCATLQERPPFEIMESVSGRFKSYLEKKKTLRNTLNTLGKIREHLYGDVYVDALRQAKELIDTIEVDRTRVKPVVKIVGEFWAQTTEGDGNFNMFAFLEREGAQVLVEPIATWAAYLMYQGKYNQQRKKAVEAHQLRLPWWDLKRRAKLELGYAQRFMAISVGEALWRYFYHRVTRHLGGLTHELVPQKELARLAAPFYNKFARGGEGHLEIGKNVYYTVNNLVHMVLALKPFGCMPSSQSDGVQSAVINQFREMIFLPIETSGEGEVNAHSRVQMALGEAKAKARSEFESVLQTTGKRLEEIKAYVAEHPELKRPFYIVPHRPGIAGTAAQFVAHVSDRMDKDSRLWRRSRSVVPAMAAKN